MARVRQQQLIRPPQTSSSFFARSASLVRPVRARFRIGRGGARLGLLFLSLIVLALLMSSWSASLGPTARASDTPPDVSSAPAAASYLYYNGTISGDGGTQTTYVPAPANGTVWDLVSAKITITASSPVGSSQNSYLYDSTCTALDVSPAPSACSGVYGPNVDGIVNDVMDPGQDGTTVGEGGYASSTPAGVAVYTHFEQTIHLNHDMFLSFGADLSTHVYSTYYLVFDPEVGDYPSVAFYRWSDAVKPLSSTPKTVTLPSPPTGYYYRAEIAVASIDLSSDPGPTRSAEILEEPAGTVLALIDDWTVRGTGVTEAACGGYSSSQTCPSDPTGTATIWDDQVIVSAGQSIEARFVGVSGDTGVFAVVLTEYPAAPAAPTGLSATSSTSSSLTWSWTNPGGDLTSNVFFWEAGSTCTSPTKVSLEAVADAYTLGSLASGTEYCAYVEAVSAGGTSPASAAATGWTTPTTVPAAPTNVSATPTNSTEIQLSWTNPSGPLTADYVEQFAVANCSGTPFVLDVGAVATSYGVTNLTAATNYGFEVGAANVVGEGPPSGCVGATTGVGAPSAPTNLTASAVSSDAIALAWTNPSGVVTDDVVYTFGGAGCTGVGISTDLGSVEVNFTSTGLSAITTYSYEVAASNSIGEGPVSGCAAATTSGAVGQNNSTVLELTVTTPFGDSVSGIVVEIEVATGVQNLSIVLGPTNDSGNATYTGLPTGTTVTNASLMGQNDTMNSYTVTANTTDVVQVLVVVTPVPSDANNTTGNTWVQFTEQGLPAGSTWWVSVTGPETENLTSSGTSINLDLENGTYQFVIGSNSYLNASQPSGELDVPNAPATLPVNFTNLPAVTSGSSPGGPGLTSAQLWQTVTFAVVAVGLSGALVLGTYLSARRRTARVLRRRARARGSEDAASFLGSARFPGPRAPAIGPEGRPTPTLQEALAAPFELLHDGNFESMERTVSTGGPRAERWAVPRFLSAPAGWALRQVVTTARGSLSLFRATTVWVRGRYTAFARWVRSRR